MENTTARLNPFEAAPGLMEAWLRFGKGTLTTGLEDRLMELVKIRASQINRCAFCLNMHTTETRAKGESEQRLYLLDAWRESSIYTARERAALGWAEALTRIADAEPAEEAYRALAAEFTEAEQVSLTMLIVVINGWNRINVGFGVPHAALEHEAA